MKSSALAHLDWSLFSRALPTHCKDPETLMRALQDAGVTAAQWEASVRYRPTQGIRGQRIMFESSTFDVVALMASFWHYQLPQEIEEFKQICRDFQVPMIAGWDADRTPVWIKVYVNASDLSVSARKNLWKHTAFRAVCEELDVPHIVALNFHHEQCEHKVYVQSQQTLDQWPTGSVQYALLEQAYQQRLYAGSVMCWDWSAQIGRVPRAFFVALAGAEAYAYEPFLTSVAPWTLACIDQVLPFVRGQCRSVGVSLTDKNQWTAYFKPRGLSVSLGHLEPIARFVIGTDSLFEVSVFVEPAAQATRAYAYTERLAISFRTQGHPAPDQRVLEHLMKWVVAAMRYAEKQNISFEKVLFYKGVPLPWRVGQWLSSGEGIK